MAGELVGAAVGPAVVVVVEALVDVLEVVVELLVVDELVEVVVELEVVDGLVVLVGLVPAGSADTTVVVSATGAADGGAHPHMTTTAARALNTCPVSTLRRT